MTRSYNRLKICERYLPLVSIWNFFFFYHIRISKIGLTEDIGKRIIITRGGISHADNCEGGVDNGSNERLCCSSGQ